MWLGELGSVSIGGLLTMAFITIYLFFTSSFVIIIHYQCLKVMDLIVEGDEDEQVSVLY